ncbi:hypothetical protein L1994_09605 [Methanomicrobium antiquum]|uniref:Uncharacterized protein n=1 Tax=Methanomicrobium antiquum TaxID=487686 RepID=A0AAF0FPT6_9EURY|nr:hypothetical protein [Methanomicrobium antiquum]WFN36389.1 hypothetical protein L1994_09605 [Methanomicrobium antiquum]
MAEEKKSNFIQQISSEREYWIIIVLLFLLTFLIVAGMILPRIFIAGADATTDSILKFTETYIAAITTVFGVWIGAGTAYFFGKESMKIAKEGMLEMKVMSPKEKLLNAKIRDLNPDKIEKVWCLNDSVDKIYTQMNEFKDWWFFVIVTKEGKLIDVYEEEAFWRYRIERTEKKSEGVSESKKEPEDEEKETVANVKKYLEEDKNAAVKKKTTGIYRKVRPDNSLAYVYELMNSENLRLAVVVDDDNIPTHYITGSKIRQWMLKD